MKECLLIVKNDCDQFHLDGIMTIGQRDRLQEICIGNEPIAAEFVVEKVEVKFTCPNGSIVVIHT